jgi:bacterial/archaeal transporter family-2 protein
MALLLMLAAVAAGMALAVQSGVNAMLSQRLGHPLAGAVASFLVGLAGLVACCLAVRVPWPHLERIRQVPLGTWTGGLLGAAYVVTTIMLAPRLGAAVMIGLVVAGQMGASLLLDHYGAVGFAVHPMTAWRVAGVALVVVGVVLIRAF